MKGNKGITLIALVITIIVLLILAGVSIAMLSGENSILNRASTAGKESSVSSAKEKIALAINEAITEHYGKVYADGQTDALLTSINTNIDNAVADIKKDGKMDAAYTTKVTDDANGTITVTCKGDNTVYTGTLTKKTAALSWDK